MSSWKDSWKRIQDPIEREKSHKALARSWSEMMRREASRYRRTPKSVFRNRTLRRFFYCNLFHDAHFQSISFDPTGRSVIFSLSANYEFTGAYNTDSRVRWPIQRVAARHSEYKCVFKKVARFDIKRTLTKVYDGKKSWRRVDHTFLSSTPNSRIRRPYEKHRRTLAAGSFTCKSKFSDNVTIDIIFRNVDVKRVGWAECPMPCAKKKRKLPR